MFSDTGLKKKKKKKPFVFDELDNALSEVTPVESNEPVEEDPNKVAILSVSYLSKYLIPPRINTIVLELNPVCI